MFGTSPFASATFAGMGSEEYDLTASAITTSAVSVANTTFQEDETLGALFITTGSPVLGQPSKNSGKSLSTGELATNNPDLDTALLQELSLIHI